jgi:hypothetical protein
MFDESEPCSFHHPPYVSAVLKLATIPADVSGWSRLASRSML